MRTKILSVTPLNPLGVTALLMNKGSREVRSVRLAEDREPRFALRKATVMRTKILSVTPLNPLGVTAPLMNKGSREVRSVRLAENREPRALPRRAQICLCGTTPSKCAATRGTPKHFAKGRNISHAQSAYFTAPQARFHTAAKLPYITAARRDAHSLLQPFGTKKSL